MFIEIRHRIPCPEGKIVFHQLFHQKTRSRVRPVQYRDIPWLDPRLQIDLYRQILLARILPELRDNRLSMPSSRPDRLGKAFFIFLNQAQCRFYDLLRTPVIHIEKHPPRIRVIALKSQHNLRLRPAEPVDRLIVISDDKEVIFRQCQHPNNLILQAVDVLKLINQDVPIPPLPGRQDIFSFRKKFQTQHHHVIEIDESGPAHFLFIACIELTENCIRTVFGIVMFQCNPLSLDRAYLT